MGYLEMTLQDVALQEKLLAQYQQTLAKLPAGRLTYKTIRGKQYYYQVDASGKQTYIGSRRHQLIYHLKYRRFLEESIRRMKTNIRLQKRLLRNYKAFDPNSVGESLPAAYSDEKLSKYLTDHFGKIPDTMTRRSEYYPEGLIFPSSFGTYFRSKSEVIIGELLHAAKIPFEPEPELRLQAVDGTWYTCRPDFRILPKIGREIYWEHAGLFTKESYRNNFLKKIADYHHNNIYAPSNLIITMDGPDGSIDVAAIERIIQGQLLPLFPEST